MLGFHRRTRSLIPVKDLGKYDIVATIEEEEEDEDEEQQQRDIKEETESQDAPDGEDRARRAQLMLVYFVFLAEA